MIQRFLLVASTGVLAFCLALGPSLAGAQDKKAPKTTPNKAPAAKKAAPEKPPVKPPAAAPANTDPAKVKAAYEAKLQQWKDMMKQLRKLQHDYQVASEADMPKIQKRWDDLMAKADQLLPELADAAIAAYKVAPNEDRAVTRFLAKLLKDEVDHDQYDKAVKLADVLISNGCDLPEIYASAGTAYFAIHQFDQAEKVLQKGKELNALSGDLVQLEKDIKDYQKFWAEEQKIRAKEAKANDLPRVKLTTTKGEIVLELFENEAPETVGNFISLVRSGFYDGLTFHRVLPGFMAQGGCPVGDGTGGPGYTIYDECDKPNARMHFRGSLSMAKTAAPNSGGSQFFITFRPTPNLNHKHTVFGRVIKGMDVVDKLQRRDPSEAGELPEPDKILKAEVIRARKHEYAPHKVQ